MYEARHHDSVVLAMYESVAHASRIHQSPFRDDAFWPLVAFELFRQNAELKNCLLNGTNYRLDPMQLYEKKESP